MAAVKQMFKLQKAVLERRKKRYHGLTPQQKKAYADSNSIRLKK